MFIGVAPPGYSWVFLNLFPKLFPERVFRASSSAPSSLNSTASLIRRSLSIGRVA
jgi:hypothetical protein